MLIEKDVLHTINDNKEPVAERKNVVVDLHLRRGFNIGEIEWSIYGARLRSFGDLIFDLEMQMSKQAEITLVHLLEQIVAEGNILL